MENKRLFIAVDLPREVKETLYQFRSRVLKNHKNARPVKTSNIHITLKFLGSVPAESIDIIEEAIIRGISSSKSFPIEIDGGLNAFPDKERARITYAGIGEGKQELKLLYLGLEESLQEIYRQFDIKTDKKDFVAHITLARFRFPVDIKDAVNDSGNITPIKIECRNITLFESILDPAGVRYTKLREFSLK